MRNTFRMLMLGLTEMVIGCESRPAAPPPPATTPKKVIEPAVAKPDTATPAQPESDDITLTVIDDKGLQAAVDQHAGKVVLVDCWATWCVPCMKAFPHTVELSRKYADEGLVVMSLSFDDPEEKKIVKVKDFLREQNAPFEHYISKLDLTDDGAKAFGIDEDSGLPHYKLYGRTGKLIKSLTSPDPDQSLSSEEVEAAVVEALK